MRGLRNTQCWTLATLGKRIGRCASQVSQIERGKYEISVALAQKIAKALNVKLSWLIAGNGEALCNDYGVGAESLIKAAMEDAEFKTMVSRLAQAKLGSGDYGDTRYLYEAVCKLVDL
jgi:transcriptional regulator with XRE-family HTH domain